MCRVSADWSSVHFSVHVPYSSRQDALSPYALGGFWDESGRGVIPIDSAFSIPRFDMGETLGKNSRALVVLFSFGHSICVLNAVIRHQLMACQRNFNSAWRNNPWVIEIGKSGKSIGRSISLVNVPRV